MSFLFATMKVPFWLLIFILACATPAWVRWYKKFYRKFIKTGLLQQKFEKVKETAEEKVDILKKATENWNNSVEKERKDAAQKSKAPANEVDQPYVKIVLKVLAKKGDAGILIQSISDALDISSNQIKNTLAYLEENKFIESVSSTHGTKYYLAARGKNYCIKRGYIAG
jgi:biopolymer transport protein ExbB/TolQ